MGTPLNVLILEDDPDDAELLAHELVGAGYDPRWRRVDTEPDLVTALDPPPDVLISDYSLPQFTALDVLRLLAHRGMDVPTIVVSGVMSEETCVEALRHGAVDYLLKDRLTRLGSAVEQALLQRRLVAEQRRAESERRRAEEAVLRQAKELARTNAELRQLDRMKRDFIGTVSHELRTPLTAIRGYTEVLAGGDGGPLTDAQRRLVTRIDQNGQRLQHLIEELLSFSDLDAGGLPLNPEPSDPAELISRARDALDARLTRAGMTLELVLPPRLPAVPVDPWQFVRLMVHLLSNAIKFSPDGGAVTVSARENAGHLVVAVRDSGIGVPEEEQERLFTRFYRAAEAQRRAIGGSGLGLAMAKAIAEAHGGWIRLESAVGVGTTVTIGIPLTPAS